uniref:Odorant receptor n=1 Tax=Colaphellus bowringi TaxID=561076 RepID=A0A0S3J3F0_9CUCU|nr:odorant receptor OR28 [Colaphellus bowringi]
MYASNLDWCLKLNFLLGVHPAKQKSFTQTLQYLFIIFGSCAIMILTVLLLYYKEDAVSMKDITDVSTNFTMFPHGMIKLTTLYMKRAEILDLLRRTKEHFWQIKDDREDVKRSYKLAKLLKNLFFNSVVLFIISAIVKPIIIGGNTLTYKCHKPELIPRWLFLIFQDAMCVAILFTLSCTDVLILTLLILTQIQFRMLNEKIQTIHDNEVDFHDRLKECVDHQNFLMDFVDRFSKVFSKTILLFIGNIILSLCMCMYIITTESANINVQMEALFHLIAGLNEICLCYSIPAQTLMNEADEVGKNAYFSKWYEHPKDAKLILQIMIRDQKRMVITAGDFVRIDMEMFLTACKTIVSYCMFLRTMSMVDQ